MSVYFDEKDVEFGSTARSLTEYRLSSDAGRWIETKFCSICGTTVFWHLELLPGWIGIAGGTLDDEVPVPERFVFERSRPCWLSLNDTIPTFDAMP